MFYYKGLFVYLRTLVLSFFILSSIESYAIGFNTLKGCILMGGVGVGGTVLAINQATKSEVKSNQALVVSGITSCLVGAIIGSDVEKKAEAEASISISLENDRLKNQALGIMLELCIMKGECTPDGNPIKKDVKKNDESDSSLVNESPYSTKSNIDDNRLKLDSLESGKLIKLKSGN